MEIAANIELSLIIFMVHCELPIDLRAEAKSGPIPVLRSGLCREGKPRKALLCEVAFCPYSIVVSLARYLEIVSK